MKVLKHFRLVNKHRRNVRKNCFAAHLYKRGLLHDLSKYSPIEFWESVKYYQGTSSPIDASKQENGWSKAWMHHKGRNRHHWEYWIDNINNGYPEAILMPYEFAVEMLCDYIGAGQVYEGKKWTPTSQYLWWKKKRNQVFIHPAIKAFIEDVLAEMDRQYDYCYVRHLKFDYKFYLSPLYLKYIYAKKISEYKDIPNHYRPKEK